MMRSRTLLLLALAALLGAAVVVLPALAASPSEAKLEVNENCVEANWPCWATPGSGARPSPASTITIAAGGEVVFADDTSTPANIAWTGTAPTCSSSVPVSPTPPATNWEGRCRFEAPGTYRFESSTLFNEGGSLDYTKYEIVVESVTSSTSTTTTTITTPTSTTTTTTTTSAPTTTTTLTTTTPTATTSTQPSGGGASTSTSSSTAMTSPYTETPSPPVGSHSPATLALASSQHGDAVHGAVQIPTVDAGGRLEVELLAQTASLAKARRHAQARVGRLVHSQLKAGSVSFSVSVNARGKAALRRHRHLALTVKITLTPQHGAAITITRAVVLHT